MLCASVSASEFEDAHKAMRSIPPKFPLGLYLRNQSLTVSSLED